VSRTKAIALLSGGLDSSIAVRMVMEQGIEVEALNFVTPFCQYGEGLVELAKELGVKLHTVSLLEDYLEVVKKPRHGYGSNLNPCIDCRILMLRRAKARMEEVGASFIVTGEVLGQRPMSQHKQALMTIDRESGLEGLVLRPLSARSLPPTKAEEEGWVDRGRLLSITGRSRREQIKLASAYRISHYSCPSGGCLLTDPGFARRLKDLLSHCPSPTLNDIELLKVGRHFRLSPSTKLVVGRNKAENERLRALSQKGDIIFEAMGHNCPVSIARGPLNGNDARISARLEARYSDAPKDGPVDIAYHTHDGQEGRLRAMSASDEEIGRLRVS
jgi:tRNA-specific 2-thiouridylase